MTIKISLTNFKCWDKKTVEIPDNGLTLLSGARNLDSFVKENDTFLYSYDNMLVKLRFNIIKLFKNKRNFQII